MTETNLTPLKIFVTAADTELGREVVPYLKRRGHQVIAQVENSSTASSLRTMDINTVVVDSTSARAMTQVLQTAQPDVIMNLIPQVPNTLLHDGHDWDNFDRTLTSTTTALVTAARNIPLKLLIQTSYAFLYGNNRAATEDSFLQPPRHAPFLAAMEAEKLVTETEIPVCLLRMGYLYGPQSQDLVAYKKSFNLFRPYYSGPKSNRANFLHFTDAASALALVAEKQPANQIFNVVDGNPASFGDFIDTFAQDLERLTPLHIPRWSAPLAELLTIRPSQVALLDLTTLVSAAKFSTELGWKPRYPNYREGLSQVVGRWKVRDND